MNAAREASGVVCSHVNFTYPYLSPQVPATYMKKTIVGWEVNSCVTYTGACVIHWVYPVDKSPGLLIEHCYMFAKCMQPETPLDCCFGRSALLGKCMLPRKPNKYMIRFHYCLVYHIRKLLNIQFLYICYAVLQ